MNVSRVIITEHSRHWRVNWDEADPYAECFPTAAAALAAVRARDTEAATLGVSSATVIEWNTTTRIGTMVVKALQP